MSEDTSPNEGSQPLVRISQKGAGPNPPHDPGDTEKAFLLRLRLMRTQIVAGLAMSIAWVGVIGGLFLWYELTQLQKIALAPGGVKDLADLRASYDGWTVEIDRSTSKPNAFLATKKG